MAQSENQLTNSYSSGRVFWVTKSLVRYWLALSFRYRGLNHSKREWYTPKWMCGVCDLMAYARSPVRRSRITFKSSGVAKNSYILFRLKNGINGEHFTKLSAPTLIFFKEIRV